MDGIATQSVSLWNTCQEHFYYSTKTFFYGSHVEMIHLKLLMMYKWWKKRHRYAVNSLAVHMALLLCKTGKKNNLITVKWLSKYDLNFQRAWSNSSEVWTAIIISLGVNSVVNEGSVNSNFWNVFLPFRAPNKRDDLCCTNPQQWLLIEDAGWPIKTWSCWTWEGWRRVTCS